MRVFRSAAVWMAAAMLLAAAAAMAQVTTESVAGITNFRQVKSTVASAGATTPESMRAIKDMGVVAVVNLRQAAENTANVEAETAVAVAAGLKYIHIPMNGAAPDPAVVDRFLAAARNPANNPMFVHCASGNRAASVWLIRRVLVDGWAVDKASEEAQALGRAGDGIAALAGAGGGILMDTFEPDLWALVAMTNLELHGYVTVGG